jgi:hypothetical protein
LASEDDKIYDKKELEIWKMSRFLLIVKNVER